MVPPKSFFLFGGPHQMAVAAIGEGLSGVLIFVTK
jgi:hypothetical protein